MTPGRHPDHHPDDIHCIVMCRGRERYMVSFRAATRSRAIQYVASWAQNKSLAFTWKDATTMRNKIMEACPV